MENMIKVEPLMESGISDDGVSLYQNEMFSSFVDEPSTECQVKLEPISPSESPICKCEVNVEDVISTRQPITECQDRFDPSSVSVYPTTECKDRFHPPTVQPVKECQDRFDPPSLLVHPITQCQFKFDAPSLPVPPNTGECQGNFDASSSTFRLITAFSLDTSNPSFQPIAARQVSLDTSNPSFQPTAASQVSLDTSNPSFQPIAASQVSLDTSNPSFQPITASQVSLDASCTTAQPITECQVKFRPVSLPLLLPDEKPNSSIKTLNGGEAVPSEDDTVDHRQKLNYCGPTPFTSAPEAPVFPVKVFCNKTADSVKISDKETPSDQFHPSEKKTTGAPCKIVVPAGLLKDSNLYFNSKDKTKSVVLKSKVSVSHLSRVLSIPAKNIEHILKVTKKKPVKSSSADHTNSGGQQCSASTQYADAAFQKKNGNEREVTNPKTVQETLDQSLDEFQNSSHNREVITQYSEKVHVKGMPSEQIRISPTENTCEDDRTQLKLENTCGDDWPQRKVENTRGDNQPQLKVKETWPDVCPNGVQSESNTAINECGDNNSGEKVDVITQYSEKVHVKRMPSEQIRISPTENTCEDDRTQLNVENTCGDDWPQRKVENTCGDDWPQLKVKETWPDVCPNGVHIESNAAINECGDNNSGEKVDATTFSPLIRTPFDFQEESCTSVILTKNVHSITNPLMKFASNSTYSLCQCRCSTTHVDLVVLLEKVFPQNDRIMYLPNAEILLIHDQQFPGIKKNDNYYLYSEFLEASALTHDIFHGLITRLNPNDPAECILIQEPLEYAFVKQFSVGKVLPHCICWISLKLVISELQKFFSFSEFNVFRKITGRMSFCMMCHKIRIFESDVYSDLEKVYLQGNEYSPDNEYRKFLQFHRSKKCLANVVACTVKRTKYLQTHLGKTTYIYKRNDRRKRKWVNDGENVMAGKILSSKLPLRIGKEGIQDKLKKKLRKIMHKEKVMQTCDAITELQYRNPCGDNGIELTENNGKEIVDANYTNY